ncbi:MAG: isopropylmalate/citramalate/homocitrate synthase 1 [Candidatus Bathyarchaeota archaeon B23]|nr:MAG: isopropylmalate/citramalate/homocitrate synthase 1 [Candidatus Bathyarchaeota archaeon B23]
MPGVSLAPEEKLEIARALDELGVDAVEAGFAAVSEGEMEAIGLIAEEGLRAEVFSASRSLRRDIDAALEAGVDGVNIIIPTSDLHLRYKLRKTRAEALEMLRRGSGAHRRGLNGGWLEDGARLPEGGGGRGPGGRRREGGPLRHGGRPHA